MPWPLSFIDPHRADDVTCAILGDALFETLYAQDGSLPVLAEGEPEAAEKEVRVTVRTGVKTARGRPFGVRDAAAAIARARSVAARPWLFEVPAPKVDGNVLVFASKEPARDVAKIARALSSPLVAMVPLGFRPDTPDGTGPFRADLRADGLSLVRNARAASGPSLLDVVTVKRAQDLSSSLRAFEGGEDDLGWLGAGLHEPRPGSQRFDLGAVAFAVLRTGHEAGTWDAPGTAQSLADGIDPSRLSHLGVGAPWSSAGSARWGGPATALLVREDSPWLVELARAVAAALTTASADVSVRPVAPQEIADKRTSRGFALMIDAFRPFGRGSLAELAALAATDDPQRANELLRRPHRGEPALRTFARTLRTGILGEIRVAGGRVPDARLDISPRAPGVDWGNARRRARGST
jgi:peptide/nickel transport system substrate-binding protein